MTDTAKAKPRSPAQQKQAENFKAHMAKPFTKENAAEMGRRGGIKAQKTIARKKQLRDCLKIIMALPPGDRNKQKLADAGVPDDDMSNQMLLAMSMFQKAVKGDVRAAEYIRDLTGQQPETKLDKARTKLMNEQARALKKQTDSGGSELTKLDQLLHSIDQIASETEDPPARKDEDAAE